MLVPHPDAAPSPVRTRIFGVDWSAARETAGHGTWIARGAVTDRGVAIDMCAPASGYLQRSPSLAATIEGLVRLIRQERDAIFGVDFPFGLPVDLGLGPTWERTVRVVTECGNAGAFRAFCRARSGGRELKRETDAMARTPFSPYNLRLYRQTYHGIAGVLAPLVADRAASVLPMEPPRPDRAWVLEVCPASTLKAFGETNVGYKGRDGTCRTRREAILGGLERAGRIVISDPSIRDAVADDVGGDALDAVIAAEATGRVARGTYTPRAGDPVHAATEGWVYV